jgi:hypothetical protein
MVKKQLLLIYSKLIYQYGYKGRYTMKVFSISVFILFLVYNAFLFINNLSITIISTIGF